MEHVVCWSPEGDLLRRAPVDIVKGEARRNGDRCWSHSTPILRRWIAHVKEYRHICSRLAGEANGEADVDPLAGAKSHGIDILVPKYKLYVGNIVIGYLHWKY